MKLIDSRWLMALVLCFSAPGHSGVDSVSEHFAAEGFYTTLANCSLPRTCGGKRPAEAKKELRETGNDSLVDQRRLLFDGLEVEFLYVLADVSVSPAKRFARPYRKPVILSMTITSPGWPVLHGLKVGTSRAAVERMLGRRGGEIADECVSYANEKTQDEAFICYARGKVRSIRWILWWDG